MCQYSEGISDDMFFDKKYKKKGKINKYVINTNFKKKENYNKIPYAKNQKKK